MYLFNHAYKNRMDAICPEPSFRSALQLTIKERTENMNHRFAFNYRRKMIIAIALIAAMLAATAVAVVQGNLLRTQMEENAGAAFANQVRDVHISAGKDFSFTVDEILCDGDKIYLSYSISVPDDGNTYLYALYRPTLNGEPLSGSLAYFYDESGMPMIHAIGGEFGASHARVMKDLKLQSEPVAGVANMFDLKAVFFKSNLPVRYGGSWDDYSKKFAEKKISVNGVPQTVQMYPDSDALYYCGETKPEYPYILLEFQPDYWKNWQAKQQKEETEDVLTPEEFAATGIVDLADSAEIFVPLDLSGNAQPEYNDVAQRVYELDGFTLEITDFHMNHLGASYKAEIRTEAEIPDEYAGTEPYGRFYGLIRADGTELSSNQSSRFSTGALNIKWDGTRVYLIDQTINGAIPVEELDGLLLAPELYAYNGDFKGYDLERAIRIQPVYTTDKPEPTPIPTEDPAATDDLSS